MEIKDKVDVLEYGQGTIIDKAKIGEKVVYSIEIDLTKEKVYSIQSPYSSFKTYGKKKV
jgi:hypothetical protein